MPIPQNQTNLQGLYRLGLIVFIILCMINPVFGVIFIIAMAFYAKRNSSSLIGLIQKSLLAKAIKPEDFNKLNLETTNMTGLLEGKFADVADSTDGLDNIIQNQKFNTLLQPVKLEKRKRYLHIALNNSLEEARNIIHQLPSSDRILIEVGTPLIKRYGTEAVRQVRRMTSPFTYIVADNKCADLASREVEMMASAGANASTCLGVAPIETIDSFIEECQKFKIDSIIDMMNVEDSLSILKKLKNLPNVVMLHRGVDETETSKGKKIPLYQIKQIKGNCNIMVAVAGGDTIKEVQSALFNDADIVVVWKNFYAADADTAQLAESFLKEIK